MQAEKIYSASFPSDIALRAFYERSHKVATAAGGNLWTARNFDDPSTQATAMLSLPDGTAPDDVLPLSEGSWTPVEQHTDG